MSLSEKLKDDVFIWNYGTGVKSIDISGDCGLGFEFLNGARVEWCGSLVEDELPLIWLYAPDHCGMRHDIELCVDYDEFTQAVTDKYLSSFDSDLDDDVTLNRADQNLVGE
jgi:hypothetical protein